MAGERGERVERERLEYLATHDQQTKLPNRAAFVESLQNVVQKASKENPGALLFIDLDNFEFINHSLGHSAGDHVLTKVGQVLQTSLRRQDTPGRFGSDEFGVLLTGVHLTDAKSVAERICSRIEEIDFSRSGRVFGVTSSNRKLHVSFNLSGQSFGDAALRSFIESAFRTAGVEPGRMTFETSRISLLATSQEVAKNIFSRSSQPSQRLGLIAGRRPACAPTKKLTKERKKMQHAQTFAPALF